MKEINALHYVDGVRLYSRTILSRWVGALQNRNRGSRQTFAIFNWLQRCKTIEIQLRDKWKRACPPLNLIGRDLMDWMNFT